MARYLVGDVQGCDGALGRLLDTIAFSPSRDTLYLLGDLVNRGPDSLAVLRRLQGLGDAVRCLLGNHDLSLLALAHGLRAPHQGDTLEAVLAAPDRVPLLDWLQHRHLALLEHGVLMVHAGVLPQWDAERTLALAAEVEHELRGPGARGFLEHLYGNEPASWNEGLLGADRLRVVVNALTRLRFCTAAGEMDFGLKESATQAPEGLMPWFEVPGRRTAGVTVAFGHWSTLGLVSRPDVLALDTGCVWGGCLSAARLGPTPAEREILSVECEQAQVPGGT
ncbi:MAG: symmetrical bis(5'-nucleosyl)-tetraphosphatase [Burkholderiales bacterium]|nr:symmetrical bis(5'-nucleosyl)-tetraphosphatase [Burkholderiales bacterium]